MVVTEDGSSARIGKFEFTVALGEDGTNTEERRRQRVASLTRLLVAQWLEERQEAN